MDKIKAAAIVILGMGDKCASEILRNMNQKDVQRVMEAINSIEAVSEEDFLKALNEFFKESNNTLGVDLSSKENIKNSLTSVLGLKGFEGEDGEISKWIELLKSESAINIVDLIQDEHPQVLTAILVILSQINNDKASSIAKELPKVLQGQMVKRMTKITPISTYAIDALSEFFESSLDTTEERYNVINVDGIEAAANIMSYLDCEVEREIISELSTSNKAVADKIQDKILPFEKISQLDQKSLRTLLADVPNEDLVLALKGVDDYIKNIFLKNMSSKSGDILRDEMEALGPVKVSRVVEAQKRIIVLAKKLGKEEKIILSTRHDGDVIY